MEACKRLIYNLLINLKFLQISSIVNADRRAKAERYQQIFQDIYDLLPADETAESRYKFRAWLNAINAYLGSSFRKSDEFVELNYRDTDETKVDLCPEFVWDKRDPPEYPERQLKRGYVGAAVIVYNLNEDGRTENVSIGAEVPSKQFGVYAVITVKNWHGHFVSTPSQECLAKQKNVILSFRIANR